VVRAQGLACLWADATQPFNIPQAGAIFSTDALISQNPFRDRAPAFTGILLEPGFSSFKCVGVFTAQTAIDVPSMTLSAELLGNDSNGALIELYAVSAGGAVTPIVGPTLMLWGDAPLVQTITPSAPLHMSPGDRLLVASGNYQFNAHEDWVSVELAINVTGAPVIMAQPDDAAVCPGQNVTLKVEAKGVGQAGDAYEWHADGIAASLGFGPTLVLTNVTDANSRRYWCTVRNACGENVSRSALVFVRTADVGSQGGISGGDGALDNNDFVVFIDRFFGHDPRADYGAQGGVGGPDGLFDNNDFVVFIGLFFDGCAS
jgi:hypothetical protein